MKKVYLVYFFLLCNIFTSFSQEYHLVSNEKVFNHILKKKPKSVLVESEKFMLEGVTFFLNDTLYFVSKQSKSKMGYSADAYPLMIRESIINRTYRLETINLRSVFESKTKSASDYQYMYYQPLRRFKIGDEKFEVFVHYINVCEIGSCYDPPKSESIIKVIFLYSHTKGIINCFCDWRKVPLHPFLILKAKMIRKT